MSIHEVKALGPFFFAEQDRLRGGPANELCAPEYTAQIGANPPMPLAGHQQFAAMFYAAFPDIHHVIEETVAEPDRVAVRFTLHGTHTGDFMGLPATGRTVAVPAIAILRVAAGKVTELHAVFDQAGMMRQLGGAPPAPAEATTRPR